MGLPPAIPNTLVFGTLFHSSCVTEGCKATVAIQIAVGVVEIVAAVGLWGLHKWAAALAVVAAALAVLTDIVGVFNAGSTTGKVIAALGIALGIAVIVAVAHPAAQRAYR